MADAGEDVMRKTRQAYLGYCGSESGLQLLIRLTHQVAREWPMWTAIRCPVSGECPDGGEHLLVAISDELYDKLGSEDDGDG
jgi:hypothetical protein